jgi:predicted phage-related endonuclease
MCRSIERPWAQASLDFQVKDGDRWGVLEIKTARSKKDWEDGVPPYYLSQVTHYMSVTGRQFADVAVFFRDTCEFAEYRVDRDEEDIELVNSAVDSFWNDFVLKDVMPELVGTQQESSALASIYGNADGEFVTLRDSDVLDLIEEYRRASEDEKAAKARKTDASTRIAALIGDHKGVQCDSYRVTWVRSRRSTFDQKRFKADHPDTYGRYLNTTTTNGGLRIREI